MSKSLTRSAPRSETGRPPGCSKSRQCSRQVPSCSLSTCCYSVLFQPFAQSGNHSFIHVRRGVRLVEYASLAKQTSWRKAYYIRIVAGHASDLFHCCPHCLCLVSKNAQPVWKIGLPPQTLKQTGHSIFHIDWTASLMKTVVSPFTSRRVLISFAERLRVHEQRSRVQFCWVVFFGTHL